VRARVAALFVSAVVVVSLIACKKESGTTTTTSEAPSCAARVDAFEGTLVASSAGACTADTDCKCYPGGVSKKHSCGGVTDTASAEKLSSIAADYLKDGCKSGIACPATVCMASCQGGRCIDGPPPKPPIATGDGGKSCDERSTEIARVLASATRKCATDKDCACFRGSVSRGEPCGGITDAKTNARFEALAKEWSAAGCKLENVMCPAMVCQATCSNGTCGPPTADKIVQ
jgi:hypothetical protein